MPAVTVLEAAAALGHKSAGQLYRWLKEGKLADFEIDGGNSGRRLELNGLAAHVNTLRQRRVTNVPVHGHAPIPPPPDTQIPDYNESRARTEWEKANLLEMERRQKEKELIPRSEWEKVYGETVARVKTRLLGVPSRFKQRVPHLSHEEVQILMDLQREALEEVSDDAGS